MYMQNRLSLTWAHLSQYVPADAGFLYESYSPQECQYKKKSVINWFGCVRNVLCVPGIETKFKNNDSGLLGYGVI